MASIADHHASDLDDEWLNFFSIFDEKIASKCLRGVTTSRLPTSASNMMVDQQLHAMAKIDLGFDVADIKMSCSTCGIVKFDDRREQVLHYKSDWHCHNLKRKLNEKPAVERTVYEKRLTVGCRDSASEDDSTNENSDVEVNSERLQGPAAVTRNARLFFRNDAGYLFSVHKCIIVTKTQADDELSNVDLAHRIDALKACPKWAVILLGGGHFAGAIFNGPDVVIHKTFHRYVVRAKQGSAQGTHDRSRPAVSAGATLRRHNEQALQIDVQTLLMDTWSSQLKDCSLIFYRSAGSNRRILFGAAKSAQPPFSKLDSRLRNIPFATKKASFKEAVRVHAKMAMVECHGFASKFREDEQPVSPRRNKVDHLCKSPKKDVVGVESEVAGAQSAKNSSPKNGISCERSGKNHQAGVASKLRFEEENESDEDEIVWEAKEIVVDVAHDLKSSECSPRPHRRRRQKKKNKNEENGTQTLNEMTTTDDGTDRGEWSQNPARNRLYTACKLGQLDVIREILDLEPDLETFLNRPFGRMETTYLHVVAGLGDCSDAVTLLLECGADPTCLDSMGRSPFALAVDGKTRKQFRRFRARFPDRYDYKVANIPAPLSEVDEAAKAERHKFLRSQRRQRAKENTREAKEREAFLNLSDTQKKMSASSKGKIADADAKVSRCFTCGESLQDKVPFEYEQFKFCQMVCLKEHRLKRKNNKN